MTDQTLVDELEKALTDEAYDGGFGYMGDEQFTAYVRTLAETAAEVVEKAHTPTDDEREVLAKEWADKEFPEMRLAPENEQLADAAYEAFCAGYDAGFRRSEVVPEPSTECPQCHRPDGLHKLGCGERFGSEPQGEPSSAQEAIRVASPDTWDWDACVVCGSKDVTDRGMMVLVSAKDGVYISRVAWCDQSQECRDDLRQAGASMLTDQDAKSIDAALRAAGGVR